MPVTRGDAEGGLGDLGVAVDLGVGGHVVGERGSILSNVGLSHVLSSIYFSRQLTKFRNSNFFRMRNRENQFKLVRLLTPLLWASSRPNRLQLCSWYTGQVQVGDLSVGCRPA